MLMNPNTYEADLMDRSDTLTHHGPHTASQQEVHIRAFGCPMAVWRWIVAPDYEGTTLDDGFEIIDAAENSCEYPTTEQ